MKTEFFKLTLLVSAMIMLAAALIYVTGVSVRPPVEEIDAKRDSISTSIENAVDSINTLDSLENEYKYKASTLNDSDAVKLFYWLLSK